MKDLTRRRFVQAGAVSALGMAVADKLPIPKVSAQTGTGTTRLPQGYLLVQGLNTYNSSSYGAISTVAEGQAFWQNLQKSPEGAMVNGLEYTSLWFGASDMQAHEAIAASLTSSYGMDLWANSSGLASKAQSFGAIPLQYQSSYMQSNGTISPSNSSLGPVLDVLNPDAVTWFLQNYQTVYMNPMKGLVSGFFFDEDNLEYITPSPANNARYPYWYNATYSQTVLNLWQNYCYNNKVADSNGAIVNFFPVHDPSMVANGGGLTAYYPGWVVPPIVYAGQTFMSLPQVGGVWLAWYDFICGQFLDNWIGRLAQLANSVNSSEAAWKGVMYFGLHTWSLPYEEIQNPNFAMDSIQGWGAWGRQRGVDLVQLAAHPEIDYVICETYPPVAANLDEFVGEWSRITLNAQKTFGVMMDRDDSTALTMSEEQQRWAVINKYLPRVITRFPVERMMTTDSLYNPQVEAYIAQQLNDYRMLW